ncbi:hypothetical protein [Anaerotignum sp.]|uniref:hypothetical protein n=1 Tax=Anaerotignum sp. TaxID=2039241 RepID=UPI0028AC9AF6|nr:hypothetical protein [Anaerotignum sp.]
MNWLDMVKKAMGTGILCSLLYHGTLFIMGQPVTVKNVTVFTVVFIVLYFVWLFMASLGRKK